MRPFFDKNFPKKDRIERISGQLSSEQAKCSYNSWYRMRQIALTKHKYKYTIQVVIPHMFSYKPVGNKNILR
jgi:hypothetical protein